MVLNTNRGLPQRGLPTRGVKVRGVQTQRLAQTTAVQRGREEEFKKNLQITANNVIGSVTNLKDLTQKAQSFYQNSLSNIPLNLHSTFKQYINDASRQLRESQSQLRNQLENSIKVYKEREQTASSPAIADKYDAQKRIAESSLKSLNAGSVLNKEATYQTIRSRGRLAQKEKEFRISQKTAPTQITSNTQLNKQINTYLQTTAQRGTINSVVQLRDRFNISLSDAKKIRELQAQNKTALESVKIKEGKEARKREKEIQRFSKGIDKDYYTRYINTNASFPPTIQKARSILLNELTTRQQSDFRQLSKSQQSKVLNYALLLNIKALTPKSSEITQTFLSKTGVVLAKNDIARLKELVLSSDAKILDIATKKDSSSINRYVKSFNSFIQQKQIKKRLSTQELLKETKKSISLRKSLSKTVPQLRTLEGSIATKIGISVLKLLQNDLSKKINQGQTITQSDYLFWKSSLNDLTGLGQVMYKNINNTKKKYGNNFVLGLLDTTIQIAKGVGQISKRATEIAIKDLKDLVVGLSKFGIRTGKAISNDAFELAERVKANLTKSQRKDLELSSVKTAKKIYKTGMTVGEFAKAIKNNPEILTLAIAGGILTGAKFSRKTFIKNPKEYLSQVASFFIDDVILTAGVRAISKIPKISKLKVLNKITDLTKLFKKTPDLKFRKTGAFYKNKRVMDVAKYSGVPTPTFRFAIKDTDGVVRYVDSKGIKRFRRAVKKTLKPYELERDVVFQFKRFMGRKKIEAKRATKKISQKQRLKIEKERVQLRKESKIVKTKRIPKSEKLQPRVTAGKFKDKFVLFDVRNNKLVSFTSRNKYIKSIKDQEKYFKTENFRQYIKTVEGDKAFTEYLSYRQKITKIDDIPEVNKVILKTTEKKKPLKKSSSPKVLEVADEKGKMVIRKDGTQEFYKPVISKNTATGQQTIQYQLVEVKQSTIQNTKQLTKQKQKYGYLVEEKPKTKQKQYLQVKIKQVPVLDVKQVSKVSMAKLLNKVLTKTAVISIAVQKIKLSQQQKQKLKQIGKVVLTQKQVQDIESKQVQKIKQIQKVESVTKVKTLTESEFLSRLVELDSQKIIRLSNVKTLESKLKKRKLKLPKLKLRLNWDSKPKGYERIVNVVIRVKGKNKELKWLTTPNRALKRITKLVDNTTARSFQLKIVGLKKIKDIAKPDTKKFRAKKSKGSAVLKVVEKSRHAIDTRGEKQGLTLSKALKKRKTTPKRKTKKQNGTTKRTNTKRKPKKKQTKKKTKKKAKKK